MPNTITKRYIVEVYPVYIPGHHPIVGIYEYPPEKKDPDVRWYTVDIEIPVHTSKCDGELKPASAVTPHVYACDACGNAFIFDESDSAQSGLCPPCYEKGQQIDKENKCDVCGKNIGYSLWGFCSKECLTKGQQENAE